jgi:hypothetical protein
MDRLDANLTCPYPLEDSLLAGRALGSCGTGSCLLEAAGDRLALLSDEVAAEGGSACTGEETEAQAGGHGGLVSMNPSSEVRWRIYQISYN